MHVGKIIISLQSTAVMSFTSTDLPAWLDQHSPSWNLFSHYPCITILCLPFGITLSTLLSLYSSTTHCLIFSYSSISSFSPLFCWLTLVFSLFFCCDRFPAAKFSVLKVLLYQLLPHIAWNSALYPLCYSVTCPPHVFRIIWYNKKDKSFLLFQFSLPRGSIPSV